MFSARRTPVGDGRYSRCECIVVVYLLLTYLLITVRHWIFVSRNDRPHHPPCLHSLVVSLVSNVVIFVDWFCIHLSRRPFYSYFYFWGVDGRVGIIRNRVNFHLSSNTTTIWKKWKILVSTAVYIVASSLPPHVTTPHRRHRLPHNTTPHPPHHHPSQPS